MAGYFAASEQKSTRDDCDYHRNMREVAKNTLLQEVLGSVVSDKWSVLIMDKQATDVVSSLVGMYEVTEYNISTVEKLSNSKRQRLPELEAIYIVSPTEQSVELIAKDFENPQASKYAGAHIFFLSRMGEGAMGRLQASPALVARLRTLREINLDFRATEAQTFDLRLPHALHRLYGRGADREGLLQVAAARLVTLCVALHEFPVVRWGARGGAGGVARALADEVSRQLRQASAVLGPTAYWYHGQAGRTGRGRATLLILDRAVDPLGPLLHEFGYQANVYDVLGLEGDTVDFTATTPEGQKKQTAVLGEGDPLWAELRHEHLAKAVNVVRARVDEFMAGNAGARLQRSGAGGGPTTMAEVSAAMRAVPEYREIVGRLTKHLSVAQRCMDAFEEQDLISIIELEQTMASGVDELNQKVNKQTAYGLLVEVLQRPNVSSEVKARLIGIYFLTQVPVTEEEKHQLYAHAGPAFREEHQRALDNLALLGVDIGAPRPKVKKSMKDRAKGLFSKVRTANIYGQAQEFTTTRRRALLDEILQDLCRNRLSDEDYPSKEGPAAAGARPPRSGRASPGPGCWCSSRGATRTRKPAPPTAPRKPPAGRWCWGARGRR